MKLLSLSLNGTPVSLPKVPTGGLGSGGGFENILHFLVNILFFGAIILSLFFIIFAGIKWIQSQGDKQKIQESRNVIIYAIIGFTIIALSFFIVTFVGNFFGVSLFGAGNPGTAGSPSGGSGITGIDHVTFTFLNPDGSAEGDPVLLSVSGGYTQLNLASRFTSQTTVQGKVKVYYAGQPNPQEEKVNFLYTPSSGGTSPITPAATCTASVISTTTTTAQVKTTLLGNSLGYGTVLWYASKTNTSPFNIPANRVLSDGRETTTIQNLTTNTTYHMQAEYQTNATLPPVLRQNPLLCTPVVEVTTK